HVLDLELGHGVDRVKVPGGSGWLLCCCCAHGLLILSGELDFVRQIIVATNNCTKLEYTARAGAQQFRQCPQPLPAPVAQLLTMGFLYRPIEPCQECEAFGG